MTKGCNAPYGDPRMMPNLDFNINCTIGGYPCVNWNDYKFLRGGGKISFLKWIITQGSVTDDEVQGPLEHRRLSSEAKCHIYRKHTYHFCHLGDLQEFARRVEET